MLVSVGESLEERARGGRCRGGKTRDWMGPGVSGAGRAWPAVISEGGLTADREAGEFRCRNYPSPLAHI